MAPNPTELHWKEAGLGAFFRPRDLKSVGVSFRQLQSLVDKGTVERHGNGLYGFAAAENTELETVAMVSATVPGAIICLLTALSIHQIGSQLPHQVWIAINRKSRKPTHPPAQVRIVRYSGAMLTCGVSKTEILGVSVSITSPARTVVDCFRYRNKIGIDVALEALRDTLSSRNTSVDEIWRVAEACRIRTVIRPYLEAMSA